ncbi:hypothetical protein AeMF1_016069 [Aphanomyces euteiches]|nr:hypothetical protein AeMF1_016069 [Aphanomyces euteiches]KAH9188008.1 hypothetical protein AeNC1_010013 [Aphanomyces euteiches]
MKWRGRVSWEPDILESVSPANSPSKWHPSPLRNVHNMSTSNGEKSMLRNDSKSQHASPEPSQDEIDALLTKFKIAAEARTGIRDTLLAQYTATPNSYTFVPSPSTEPATDMYERPLSPSVPERKFKNVQRALEGGSSDEEDDDPEAQEMKELYFGLTARGKFFEKYAGLHAKPHCFMPATSKSSAQFKNIQDLNGSEVRMSPRTRFLSACLSDAGEPPLPLLIRKHGTTTFDFSHQSLGDTFIMEFARALRDVPYVEAINVCDNRLSDRALNELLIALETKPNLTRLDISRNEIGARSAKTLKAYIGSSGCTLQHLSVCKADIDDIECVAFMVAFEANKSVVELRMSRNRIGEAENLNVVQPNFTTGGEALGNMLNVNLTLTTLDVSWNLLRLASGITLANSLKLNYNLYELTLAYNALGDAGAMAFGQALVINKTLRVLDLSFNNISTKGASVLASTVLRSHSLTTLTLDGNNIGHQGGKVLMYSMVNNRSPSGCTVSMKGCNLNERNRGQSLFDPLEPGGDYMLDCSDPYDNMVASELLRLATFRKGCAFGRIELKPTRDAPKKSAQPIKLVRREPTRKKSSGTKTLMDLSFHDMDVNKTGSITLTDLHHVLLELGFHPSLAQTEVLFKKIDADNSGTIDEAELSGDLFHAVFQLIDANGSGTIDMEELRQAFVLMGAKATERDVEAAMCAYDVDGSGTIEEDEFVELMRNQVIQRVDQHQAANSAEALALRDESTGAIWTIPSSGFLDIGFIYERELMNERESFACYGLSDRGLKKIVQSVERGKETMQQQDLLNAAVMDTEIRMTAAQAMTLMESCGDMQEQKRVGAVARLLPQLTASKEAQALVKRVLTLRERYMLRLRLGPIYFPLLGIPTNHYVLDLSRPQERLALVKLAEIAQAEKQFSKARSGRGDTSQHGNWENFRNEMVDGKPAILTSSFFQTMPLKGKLEFDYVSTTRPPRGTKPMSDRRFQQLLSQIGRDDLNLIANDSPPRNVHERWNLIRETVRGRKIKQWILDMKKAFHVTNHSKEHIGVKLFQIETAVCDRWITVAQAGEIVRCMPTQNHGKTETCRILFPRIIDIENFMQIFDTLMFPEKAECAYFLGWLNILNPQFPDRYYEFDLSVREEREAVKIFVRLATTEPGENWIHETFGWVRGEPPIPGWELPKSWANVRMLV